MQRSYLVRTTKEPREVDPLAQIQHSRRCLKCFPHTVVRPRKHQMDIGHFRRKLRECLKQQVRPLNRIEPAEKKKEARFAHAAHLPELCDRNLRIIKSVFCRVDPVRDHDNPFRQNPALGKIYPLALRDRYTRSSHPRQSAPGKPVVAPFQKTGTAEWPERSSGAEQVRPAMPEAGSENHRIQNRPVPGEVHHISLSDQLIEFVASQQGDKETPVQARDGDDPHALKQRETPSLLDSDIQSEHHALGTLCCKKAGKLVRALRRPPS